MELGEYEIPYGGIPYDKMLPPPRRNPYFPRKNYEPRPYSGYYNYSFY